MSTGPHDDPDALSNSLQFSTTHWSLVLAAGRRGTFESNSALERLCKSYWPPLYAYVRRRVSNLHEAQDLTQAFFERVLDREYLAEADPERGRFRAFLLTAFKHFLSKEWDKARAQKRGGDRRRLSFDFVSQDELEPADQLTPEKLFERQWAITLLGRFSVRAHDQKILALAVSSDGRMIASAGRDRRAKVWSIGLGGEIAALAGDQFVSQMTFSQDGQRVAGVDTEGKLLVWDAHTGQLQREIVTSAIAGLAANSAQFVPVSDLIVTINKDGSITVWDLLTGTARRSIPIPVAAVAMTVSPDGRRLAAGSLTNGHPDGDKVVSGSWDGSLRLWEVASGKELYRVGGGTREYDSTSVSPKGDLFATGTGFTSEIRLHDARTGILVATLLGASERVGVTAFSVNGAWIGSGGESGEVAIWDVSRRTKRWTARLGQGRIRSVTASANNQWVAALSQSGAIALWDIETGQQKYSLEEPGAYCLRFTPDNRRLASAGADAALKFWTVDTGQKVCTIAGHKGRIYSMAFSPDGRRLATTGDAGAVFVRDAGQSLPSLANPIPTQP